MLKGSNLRTTLSFTYLNWTELRRETGARVRNIEQARWALGDLLAQAFGVLEMTPELEAAFAAEGASWDRLAAAVGTGGGELRRYARVAIAFPRRKRVSGVGWEHHWAVLQALPQASLSLRQKWLREAARYGWSVRQLMLRIRAKEAKKLSPPVKGCRPPLDPFAKSLGRKKTGMRPNGV